MGVQKIWMCLILLHIWGAVTTNPVETTTHNTNIINDNVFTFNKTFEEDDKEKPSENPNNDLSALFNSDDDLLLSVNNWFSQSEAEAVQSGSTVNYVQQINNETTTQSSFEVEESTTTFIEEFDTTTENQEQIRSSAQEEVTKVLLEENNYDYSLTTEKGSEIGETTYFKMDFGSIAEDNYSTMDEQSTTSLPKLSITDATLQDEEIVTTPSTGTENEDKINHLSTTSAEPNLERYTIVTNEEHSDPQIPLVFPSRSDTDAPWLSTNDYPILHNYLMQHSVHSKVEEVNKISTTTVTSGNIPEVVKLLSLSANENIKDEETSSEDSPLTSTASGCDLEISHKLDRPAFPNLLPLKYFEKYWSDQEKLTRRDPAPSTDNTAADITITEGIEFSMQIHHSDVAKEKEEDYNITATEEESALESSTMSTNADEYGLLNNTPETEDNNAIIYFGENISENLANPGEFTDDGSFERFENPSDIRTFFTNSEEVEIIEDSADYDTQIYPGILKKLKGQTKLKMRIPESLLPNQESNDRQVLLDVLREGPVFDEFTDSDNQDQTTTENEGLIINQYWNSKQKEKSNWLENEVFAEGRVHDSNEDIKLDGTPVLFSEGAIENGRNGDYGREVKVTLENGLVQSQDTFMSRSTSFDDFLEDSEASSSSESITDIVVSFAELTTEINGQIQSFRVSGEANIEFLETPSESATIPSNIELDIDALGEELSSIAGGKAIRSSFANIVLFIGISSAALAILIIALVWIIKFRHRNQSLDIQLEEQRNKKEHGSQSIVAMQNAD